MNIASAIASARGVPIADEVARRGIQLKGRGSKNRYGPCPRCGGTDRFSINPRRGLWNCRGCGQGGDVIDLVVFLDGCDFREAVSKIAGDEAILARPRPTQQLQLVARADDAETRARALAIWDAAVPLPGSMAEIYLFSRGIRLTELGDLSHALRFHPDCQFGKVRHPCLVALYVDLTSNTPKAISRTAIPNGKKLGAAMSLGATGGSAVKITMDNLVTDSLVVGEGIETVLAGMLMGHMPAWALGSAGAIRDLAVIPGVDLTVLVDNDAPDANGRRAGPDAANECQMKWRAAGRKVELIIPPDVGDDAADMWMKQLIAGSRAALDL